MTTKFESTVSKELNLPTAIPNLDSIDGEIITPENDDEVVGTCDVDLEEDYTSVRRNLNDMMEKGQTALEAAVDVAINSEDHRSFDTVAKLLASLGDVNRSLLGVHKQVKEARSKPADHSKRTTNNNLVISTADLLKLMKNAT